MYTYICCLVFIPSYYFVTISLLLLLLSFIIVIIIIDTTVIVVMAVVYSCLYLGYFLLLTCIIINIFVNVKDLVLETLIIRDLLF